MTETQPGGHAAAASRPQALAGLKVLELGQLIAGPFAGKTLADFGADVIKVEPAGVGDPLRKWRMLRDGTSVWWEAQSSNKRSICLDLRSPEGRAVKFVHRGSYDGLDNTYEAITNYLDEKRLESKDMFIEEYVTDPLTTSDDRLVVNVYVLVK